MPADSTFVAGAAFVLEKAQETTRSIQTITRGLLQQRAGAQAADAAFNRLSATMGKYQKVLANKAAPIVPGLGRTLTGGATIGPKTGAAGVHVAPHLYDPASVDGAVRGSEQVANATNRTADDARRAADALSLQNLSMVAGRIEMAGQRMVNSVRGALTGILNLGQQFQRQRTTMSRVFKGDTEAAGQAMTTVMEVSAKTSLDTLQAMNLFTTFKRQQADALKTYNVETLIAGKMQKTQITGLELVNDLLAESAQDPHMIMGRHFPMAIQGQMRNFRALFDGVQNEAETRAFKAAKTAQERADVIFGIIARVYGGAGKAAEKNWYQVMQNIGDIKQNLLGLVGEGLVAGLTPALMNDEKTGVLDMLTRMSEDKKFVEELRGSFERLGAMIGRASLRATELVNRFVELTREHPRLVEVGFVIATIASALTLGAGKSLGLVTNLAMLGVQVLPSIMSASLPVIVGFSGLLAVVGLLAAAGYGLYYAWENNLSGIGEELRKLTRGIQGVWQVVTSFSNGMASIDSELADKLRRDGTLDVVIEIGSWFGKIKEGATELFEYIGTKAPLLIEPFSKMLSPLLEAIQNIFDMQVGGLKNIFGGMFEGLDLSDPVEVAKAGVDWIIEKATQFMGFVTRVLNVANEVYSRIKPVLDIIREGMGAVVEVGMEVGAILYEHLGKAFSDFWEGLQNAWGALDSIWTVLTSHFGPMIDMLRSSDSEMSLVESVVRRLLDPVIKLAQGVSMIARAFAWLFEKVTWITGGSLGKVAEAFTVISETSDALWESIDSLGKSIRDWFSETALGSAFAWWDSFTDKIEMGSSAAKTFFETVIPGYKALNWITGGDEEAGGEIAWGSKRAWKRAQEIGKGPETTAEDNEKLSKYVAEQNKESTDELRKLLGESRKNNELMMKQLGLTENGNDLIRQIPGSGGPGSSGHESLAGQLNLDRGHNSMR